LDGSLCTYSIRRPAQKSSWESVCWSKPMPAQPVKVRVPIVSGCASGRLRSSSDREGSIRIMSSPPARTPTAAWPATKEVSPRRTWTGRRMGCPCWRCMRGLVRPCSGDRCRGRFRGSRASLDVVLVGTAVGCRRFRSTWRGCGWAAGCRHLSVRQSAAVAWALRAKASLVPPEPVRHLRDLTRYRASLAGERTREAQRLEEELEDAGIKLSSVATDIMGGFRTGHARRPDRG
jgi:hypothetical protein